jgi:DNA primase
VNSPESEIYHKSNILYGLFFAKKAIREEDNCYLVEGYADVISVHQAGIENVVASSGTSLTVEQIRLIGRLTKNITILYDGDAAGVKASLRGLDMILEEGLNVKVVLFPDGHDPDSYVQKFGTAGFKKHIDDNKKDFILFKTSILLKEAGTDPLRRAEIIREVVESIAKIPDSIKASVFIQECSRILQIDERSLLTELNKMRQAKAKKEHQQKHQQAPAEMPDEPHFFDEPVVETVKENANQEKEIVRLLLLYGNKMIDWDGIANTYIGPFMIAELSDIEFDYPPCQKFIELYAAQVDNGVLPDEQYFIHYNEKSIVDLAVDLISTKYTLSENWYDMHKIMISDEQTNMKATILGGIFHVKKMKVEGIIDKLTRQLLVETDVDNQIIIMQQQMQMKKVHKAIADYLGTVVPK